MLNTRQEKSTKLTTETIPRPPIDQMTQEILDTSQEAYTYVVPQVDLFNPEITTWQIAYKNPAADKIIQQTVIPEGQESVAGVFTNETWTYLLARIENVDTNEISVQRIMSTEEKDLVFSIRIVKTEGGNYIIRTTEILGDNATLDPDTKAYNRAYYEKFKRDHSGVVRNSIGVGIFDCNDLKLTNDTYGHKAGDDLLKLCAIFFKTLTRENDTLCRIGGDEYSIFLHDADSQGIKAISKRFRTIYSMIKNPSKSRFKLTEEEKAEYQHLLTEFNSKIEEAGLDLDKEYEPIARTDSDSLVQQIPLPPQCTLRSLFSFAMGFSSAGQNQKIQTLPEAIHEADKRMFHHKQNHKQFITTRAANKAIKNLVSHF